MTRTMLRARTGLLGAICMLLFMLLTGIAKAETQVTAFRQAVAEAASRDEAIAEFYRTRNYEPLWTAADQAPRRTALFAALQSAGNHGLPVSRYDVAALVSGFRTVVSERDRGLLDVAMTRAFLTYAKDVQTGVLTPKEVDSGILREVPLRNRLGLLRGFEHADPVAFLRGLPPSSPEYARLMKARIVLDRQIAAGGWGDAVSVGALAPGDSGAAVIALRDRLVRMGYLARTASPGYDPAMEAAIRLFQSDMGLTADGIADETTLAAINVAPERRLESILVAMERERWINMPLGKRHIWVNLTDFTARIVDDGKVTFETRAVVGKDDSDTRSPEFSDQMEFMVVNPTWNVPRSITVKEYLPMLQRNPNAASHLTITDRRGRVISRGAINFAAYDERTFPFSMSQPPSERNALGLVKFMFPNPYNIYLHDTPQKALFEKEVRAYSHGCIRLHQPFDFAYALLAAQSDDPQGLFASHLNTGAETAIRLDQPVPVHLEYRTAFTTAKGRMNYRRDIYGRDARIFAALQAAGVALRDADS